ncbi:hypothetical protein D3C86_706500 [compost metagenome]
MTTARLPVRITASDGTTSRVLAGPVTCRRSSRPGVSVPRRLSTSKRAFRVRVAALTSGRISSSVPSNDWAASAWSTALTFWPRASRTACASGISATAQTFSRPAMRNSVMPGVTATPSRTPSSATTPSDGAVST